eukprot:6115375-Pyramimonas_sp.AAC.1
MCRALYPPLYTCEVSFWGSTQTYGVRKESAGQLNFRVMRQLDKVLMVTFTVSVSSPIGFTVGRRIVVSGPTRLFEPLPCSVIGSPS